ncbi:hypothetical protein TgHK011_008815 [Trichoderma gracile]|nr:hypothetical protein TgHK011_008815 [Trichoderma gracile]
MTLWGSAWLPLGGLYIIQPSTEYQLRYVLPISAHRITKTLLVLCELWLKIGHLPTMAEWEAAPTPVAAREMGRTGMVDSQAQRFAATTPLSCRVPAESDMSPTAEPRKSAIAGTRFLDAVVSSGH